MSIALLKDFAVTLQVPVAWGEMDSFGHVNNILYFRYFENARFEYFKRVEMLKLLETERIGPIIAETYCKFIKPVTFPDTVTVGARIPSYSDERFVHEYTIVSEKLQAVVAVGSGTIVAYDYNTKAKTRFPDWVRTAVSRLEGRMPAPYVR